MRSRTATSGSHVADDLDTFLRATRAWAVGSIHDEQPGSQGQALKLGSSSTIEGLRKCAIRYFNRFSIPEVSSSQATPRRSGSSCTPRRQCSETQSAVDQCGLRTAAQGYQL